MADWDMDGFGAGRTGASWRPADIARMAREGLASSDAPYGRHHPTVARRRAYAPSNPLTRVARLAGGALSAALIIGLAIWSYNLAMRQAYGVPVLAAPEGPARVPAENPGGELADHQGLAVNMIPAAGEAERAADLLVLAPRAYDLADEDTASDALRITGGTALAPPADTFVAPGPTAGLVQPSETMRALRPAPGWQAVPLPDGAVEPVLAPDLEMVTADAIQAALIEAGAGMGEIEVLPAKVPGLAHSLRPMARPVAVTLVATMVNKPKAEPASEIPAASLTVGTQLAQIGSYGSPEEARQQWDAAAGRYGALFDGKSRVIEEAESGGRLFYRLRVAGFDSKEEARRFCAALKSGGQCVSVQVK
ncbi:MAG: SPOR domain-containing protein [Paracoccaceae bacterium]